VVRQDLPPFFLIHRRFEVFLLADFENYEIKEFPLSRLATMDIGAAAFAKHHIRVVLELDVTEARDKIARLKEQGDQISFNAWLIKCISQAVSENKAVHGLRKGKRKVILFEDIDVSVMIEREIEGVKVPLPYLVSRTNKKSIGEISAEIAFGRKQDIENEKNFVLGDSKNRILMKAYYTLPGFVRSLIWKQIIKRPLFFKKNMGTVMVTSVGMVGEMHGWIIPVSVHPLCFAVGSIVKKPWVVNDEIKIREILYLTALVDHDVIDGAPAVRAFTHLKKLIESGSDL
jgi:hypothetical protein